MRLPSPVRFPPIWKVSDVSTTSPRTKTSRLNAGAVSGMVGQGTLGGRRKFSIGNKGMGDEKYLWILVLIEVGLVGGFRHIFRRRHGG
jgi:ABC-type phosphate/phosphonate transport system permease subunit